ncbi:MAG TPA: methyltransferase [Polyangia bacterium]|nr:methyltransferase [Polyangia bacterium]
MELAAVEAALHRLFIAAEGTSLRREDLKKARETAALLDHLARIGRPDRLVVDAAAGKAYVGLLAAELCGFARVHVIERDPRRADLCRQAVARLSRPAEVRIVEGDVADRAAWPDAPDVVVGLHACGSASDAILDAAVAVAARWLLVVPCCYAQAVAFSPTAEAHADALGVPRHAEVRRRVVMSLIDAERTLRLEAAGWETTVAALVPPTVTPHNLMWRARRMREPGRMQQAAAQLARLRAGGSP